MVGAGKSDFDEFTDFTSAVPNGSDGIRVSAGGAAESPKRRPLAAPLKPKQWIWNKAKELAKGAKSKAGSMMRGKGDDVEPPRESENTV